MYPGNPKSTKMKETLPVRVTERDNPAADALDTRKTRDILRLMNLEDQKVAVAVKKALPQITRAVDLAADAIASGGRLVYIGAGTSGRLGLLDASECQPTFGTDKVVAILAGGTQTMVSASEGTEDKRSSARKDLQQIGLSSKDVLVGIAASGRTPYTLEALRFAKKKGAATVGLTANPESPMEKLADVVIAVNVGPEIVSGSTRLKAGTAQKLVLNMISTAAMVKVGRVFSGLMIHMEMTNEKLRERGISILTKAAGIDVAEAGSAMKAARSNIPAALLMIWKKIPRKEALRILKEQPNTALALRQARDEHRRQHSGHRRRTTSKRKS